jgi:hypothetical protein
MMAPLGCGSSAGVATVIRMDGGYCALDFPVQPFAGGLRPVWPTVAVQSCLTAGGR